MIDDFLIYSECLTALSKYGGSVVYCVQTLSPSQGDRIIYSALQQVQQDNPNVRVSVQDMSMLAEKFRDVFSFSTIKPYCHLGQLVIPNLTANYGPLYFCRVDVQPLD